MTYEEFCKVPIGTVIIDDNGCSYIKGEWLLWPSNPSEPFSVIRHHKFLFDGFRNATEEETKAFFDALQTNSYKWNTETAQVEELPKAFDKLLDKAAKDYATIKITHTHGEIRSVEKYEAFKAGAKWMAEQGWKEEAIIKGSGDVVWLNYGLDLPIDLAKVFKDGDKVIVQIRKVE